MSQGTPSADNTSPSPFLTTLRAQWFGDQLRRLRRERGTRREQAAQHLNRDVTDLDRYERGESPIRRADVTALLDLYGQQHTSQRERLLSLAGHIWRLHLWEHQCTDLERSVYTAEWLSSRAESVYVYQLSLDTEYLEATMQRADATPVEAIIADTPALDSQLDQLAELRHRTGLDIRFLPARAALAHGPREPFTVFAMPSPYPPVGYQDGLAGRLVVEGPVAVRFVDTYQKLQAKASSPAASSRLIASLAHRPGSQ